MDRDPHWTETPLDRDPQTETPDRDPLTEIPWTETPRQRPPGQRMPSHVACDACWDRDPAPVNRIT